MVNFDKIIREWSYRINDGTPDLEEPYKIQKLREALRSLGYPNKFITGLLQNLKEAACKPGQNPERDGCTAQSGKTGSGTKEEPEKPEKEEPEKVEKPEPQSNGYVGNKDKSLTQGNPSDSKEYKKMPILNHQIQ